MPTSPLDVLSKLELLVKILSTHDQNTKLHQKRRNDCIQNITRDFNDAICQVQTALEQWSALLVAQNARIEPTLAATDSATSPKNNKRQAQNYPQGRPGPSDR